MRRWEWWVGGLWLLGWGVFGFPRDLFAPPQLSRIEWVPELHKPTDMTFNFVYYVVFGLLASRLGLNPRAALGLGAVFSGITETSQVFSLQRNPSATDVVVNVAGTLMGVWLVARRGALREVGRQL